MKGRRPSNAAIKEDNSFCHVRNHDLVLTSDMGDAAQAEQEVQGAAGEQGTRLECGPGTDPEEAF